MTEEKESVLKRIQKLLQMSTENGASENEAMLAADKAQKLLQEHNLSIADIKDDSQVEPMESEDVEVDRDLWKGYIRNATAKLYFCSTYFTTKLDTHYKRVKVVTFVGRKSNLMVATEMCKYFINTVERLADEEFREVPGSRAAINKMAHAFKQGAASKLSSRLKKRYEEIKELVLTILSVRSIMTDITSGALYYHADYVNPYWAKTKKRIIKIEHHIFYK